MKISKRTGSVMAVVAVTLAMGAVNYQAAQKADGAEIYKSKCSMCHGVDGKGFAALKTPDFTDPKWQAAHDDKERMNALENGVPATAMRPRLIGAAGWQSSSASSM